MMKEKPFKIDKDIFRKKFIKYTRKAFQVLPELDNPRILDIGCGTGAPTMELAWLCNGHILAVDIDQLSLDILSQKIEEAGLQDRVRAVKCSLFELDFPDEAFDIIWAEGSIHIIGFERGLKEWRQLLNPKGFLVVHDESENIAEKRAQILRSGYDLIEHFVLPGDMWWKVYFDPLEKHINEIRKEYSTDPAVLSVCDTEQREIDMVKKNPRQYGSAFFVMQKR